MPKPVPDSSNEIIESQLENHLTGLEEKLCSDVLVFSGRLTFGADDLFRDAVEILENKKEKLTVILETTGGYIEVVQRIADTLRRHYRYVDFIIPNYAMSAGTVLVMSGNAIYMDYYSILGPIDPQVERPGSKDLIPALGYLVQYDRLIEKSKKGKLTTAELTFLIEKFDPAELYHYEQSRELSISLLKEWLVKYKFKNWTKTQSRKIKVTNKIRENRAKEIAKILNDTKRWHSHGRGISMEVLRKELKLKIEDFGEDSDLNSKIRKYYKLLVDYMMRRGHLAILQIRGHYIPLVRR